MPVLDLLSPAKLNLFLHINGRRPDGYHELQTVFQLLDYGDQLRFTPRNDDRIQLTPSIPGVPDAENLIVRAARLLQPHAQTPAGIDIELTKRLPMGGGLGGGSSNAATTLVALNYLWQCQLDLAQLLQLGVGLGADVPVFIGARSAWAEGIGEQLQAIELPEKWFVVINPDCQVSTAEIFSNKSLTRDAPRIKVAAFLEHGGENSCQQLVRKLYPPVDKALNWLEQTAGNSRMTGTGACVFSVLSSREEATQVLMKAPKDLPGFIAKGINQSKLSELLQ